MNPEPFYYDVTPLILEAGRESVIRIRPRHSHAAFPPAEKLEVRATPTLTHEGLELGWRMEAGELVIQGCFPGEQEHEIAVSVPGTEFDRRFHIYSLHSDWYGLRPFKGDFHIHTDRSDGREAPEYVAARYREEGFDFIAVTDHHRYEPSLEAIDFWRRYPTGLALYPGEEVHPPGCPVHMVNFGGRESVNALFRDDEAGFRREVAARIPGLGTLPPGADPFAVAASGWVFDRIRAAGGLGIYCHPYWYAGQRVNVLPEALVDAVFARREFDAAEAVGGFFKSQSDSNNLQVVRCYEEWARGGAFPLVGLSDSHGADRGELFGWYYTIVLAKSSRLDDLTAAIRTGRAAAVEAPEGERVQCFGGLRMVRFAQYLIRSYFPYHRFLCRSEGEVMRAIAAKEEGLTDVLAVLGRRPDAWRERVCGGVEAR